MAFSYAVLQGIGRAARRDREQQDVLEHEQRQQARQTRQNFLAHLDRIATDENWPEQARTAAAHGALTAIMDPKFDEKRAARIWEGVWKASSRPAPQPTGERATAQIADSTRGADTSALDALVPGGGMGSLVSTAQQQATAASTTPRQQLFGMTTQGERDARAEQAAERQFQQAVRLYGAQQQYKPPTEVSAGASLMGPDGRIIGTAPANPTRPENQSEYERWASLPPEQREKELALRRAWTGAGREDNSAASSKPPRYQRTIMQQPDGSLAEVLTNPQDPNEPAVVRLLPTGLTRPESEGGKDRRAALESMIAGLDDVSVMLANNPNAVGPVNSIKYKLREYTGLFGENSPETVQIRNTLFSSLSEELHRLSGAAISPAEAARLQSSLPRPNTTATQVEKDLQVFTERIKRIYKLRYGPAGRGNPQQFPGDVESSAASAGLQNYLQSGTNNATARLTGRYKPGQQVRTRDGRTITIDALSPDGRRIIAYH